MNTFQILQVPIIKDSRGSLGVIDKLIPFEIKRVFFIYKATAERGGHRHHKTTQAMVCLSGSVDIYMNNGKQEEIIQLNSPDQCLIIKPEDWHTMNNFSEQCVLLVMASEHYDKNDYISEPYQ